MSPGQRDAEIVDAVKDFWDAYRGRAVGQPRQITVSSGGHVQLPSINGVAVRFLNYTTVNVWIRRGTSGEVQYLIPPGMGKEIDLCANASELWAYAESATPLLLDYEILGETCG